MEPRKVTKLLHPVYTAYDMTDGKVIYPPMLFPPGSVVWFFPQAVTHMFVSKNTVKMQAAPTSSSTTEVKVFSSLSNNRELQMLITQFPVHKRCFK